MFVGRTKLVSLRASCDFLFALRLDGAQVRRGRQVIRPPSRHAVRSDPVK